MKAGTVHHLKTKRLQRRLGRPLFQVVGVLELLWQTVIECAWDGGIGRYSDDEIEDGVEWDGERGELVSALIESRFLDPAGVTALGIKCRLVVHDWIDHCPDFVKKRIARERARRTTNKDLDTDLSASGSQCPPPADDGSQCPDLSANGAYTHPIQTHPNQSDGLAQAPEQAEEKGPKRRPIVTVEDLTFPSGLDTPEVRSAADEWLAYKRKRRSSYQDADGMNRQLLEFVTCGPAEFIAAVNRSIARNYQGLFPEKGATNGNAAQRNGIGQVYDPERRVGTF